MSFRLEHVKSALVDVLLLAVLVVVGLLFIDAVIGHKVPGRVSRGRVGVMAWLLRGLGFFIDTSIHGKDVVVESNR